MITANLLGRDFVFETKPGLFSKDHIDDGSKLLIDNLMVEPQDCVVDLGCGYGAIGIVAASLANKGRVYLVDTDIRAVKYAQINSKLNKLTNVEVLACDGFEALSEVKFDLVLSNPPTHMPKETILEFLEGAKRGLKTGGRLMFVTEKRVKPFIKREFERVFGNYQAVASSPKHVVSLACT